MAAPNDAHPLTYSPDESAARIGVSPNTLRRMLEESPQDLPGRPISIGRGTKRTHWRWRPADLERWLEAFSRWQRGEWNPPARRTGRRA